MCKAITNMPAKHTPAESLPCLFHPSFAESQAEAAEDDDRHEERQGHNREAVEGLRPPRQAAVVHGRDRHGLAHRASRSMRSSTRIRATSRIPKPIADSTPVIGARIISATPAISPISPT